MNSQYRIYYESYEQALHFLAPALLQADPTATFDLVSITKIRKDSTIANHIVSALILKNPDALFTKILDGGEEIGFAWIEVSTAVDTQDHDLQRFDSVVAAAMSGIPFIKVWARRSSSSSHGGQLNYDLEQSLKLSWQSLNAPAIEVEWPINPDKTRAIRNPKHMSCPDGTLKLADVLITALEGLDGYKNPNHLFLNTGLIKYPWIQNKINSYLQPLGIFNPNNSTRLYKNNNRWHFKFNRWGHAMDPERGMSWFYSNRIGQRLIGLLNDPDANTINEAASNFKNATGINLNIIPGQSTYNIDNIILNSVINRSGRSILCNCDEFRVCDISGNILLELHWTIPASKIPLPLVNTGPSTKLYKLDKTSEDDVTYAVANLFYPVNGFSVHSVSYPGAQGDFALLEGGGRKVKRTYIDVIALKNSDGLEIVGLTESKGSTSSTVISGDADKVSEWKNDTEKRNILLKAIERSEGAQIHASVAFPGEVMVPFASASKIDFIVTVSSDGWVVWPKAGKKIDGVDVMQGVIQLLPRWHY